MQFGFGLGITMQSLFGIRLPSIQWTGGGVLSRSGSTVTWTPFVYIPSELDTDTVVFELDGVPQADGVITFPYTLATGSTLQARGSATKAGYSAANPVSNLVANPAAIDIPNAEWSNTEAVADTDTRKSFVQVLRDNRAGFELHAVRGADAGGIAILSTTTPNLAYISSGSRLTPISAGLMTWQSGGLTPLGGMSHVRLVEVETAVGYSSARWCSEIQSFQASNTPAMPTGITISTGAGEGQINVNVGDTGNGRGRTISGMWARINGGAAFALSPTGGATGLRILTALGTSAVDISVFWRNVNGDSSATTPVSVVPGLPADDVAAQVAPFGALTPANGGGFQPYNAASELVTLTSISDPGTGTRTWSISGGKLVANGTPDVDNGRVITCAHAGGTVAITIASEASTYSVATDAELAVIMALSAATLAGKQIAMRDADFTFVASQWSNRAIGSLLRVRAHTANRARLVIMDGNAVSWAAARNMQFEDIDFYVPYVIGTSNGSVAAITLTGAVDNHHFLRCAFQSNLRELIASGVPSYTTKTWRGFFGSDGGTNLAGPQSFIDNEFSDLGRVFTLRIGGVGKFTFVGNEIHDFGSDAGIFAGRPGDTCLIAFNKVHKALIGVPFQFLVTFVDVDLNRITIDTDALGGVGATETLNIGTNTTTPPGGMNYPGVGGGNDYACTVLSVSGGQTVLQVPVDITSAGDNVYVNREPTHADGFQFIPGTTGGDAYNIQVVANDLYLNAAASVTWPQGLFFEDVSSSGSEGHYNGTIVAYNRVWCGTFNGITVANPINCLVAGNSLIEPHDRPDIPGLKLGESWNWGGRDNYVLSNVAPTIGVDSLVTNTLSRGNVLLGQAGYAASGLFVGTDGYSPANLEAFQAAFTRTDLVGSFNGSTHIYDAPLINPATVSNFTAITGAAINTQTTSAPVQVTNILNSAGATSAYGATVSVPAGAEFRVTSDVGGAAVVHNWGAVPRQITAGQYLWLRVNSPGAGETTAVTLIKVGAATASWSITTAAVTGFALAASYSGKNATTADLAAMGVQAGDLVIAAYAQASGVGRTPTFSGTGYTQVGATLQANSSNDTNLSVWYKTMGGTPDTSLVSPGGGNSTDGESFMVQIWRGVNATPMDVAHVTAIGTGTRAANPAAITPITAGAKIVVIAASAHADLTPVVMSSGYMSGELHHEDAGSSRGDSMIMGYVDWTSGAYDPATMTIAGSVTGDSWAAFTLALRPA